MTKPILILIGIHIIFIPISYWLNKAVYIKNENYTPFSISWFIPFFNIIIAIIAFVVILNIEKFLSSEYWKTKWDKKQE